MSLYDDLKKAFDDKIPAGPCTIQQKAEKGVETFAVPPKLYKLVCLFEKRRQVARAILEDPPGLDGGLWFRTDNLANAVRYMIEDELRSHHGPPSNSHYDLYANYQYSRR